MIPADLERPRLGGQVYLWFLMCARVRMPVISSSRALMWSVVVLESTLPSRSSNASDSSVLSTRFLMLLAQRSRVVAVVSLQLLTSSVQQI